MKNIFAALILIFLFHSSHAQSTELGQVNWLRDLDKGIAQARTTGKPIFLLFQEVPGCATCRNYGKDVLSHPLIVDAIETAFIPVAIFNNKGGEDAEILMYFNEPSWNNPVVRIIDANKLDLAPRVSGQYTALGVVNAMVSALTLRESAIPEYLSLLSQEVNAHQEGTEEAVLSMYCFWTGEKTFGQLEGVVATEPGFMNGQEVVKVTFVDDVLDFKELVLAGKNAKCADNVFTDDPDQVKEAKALLSSNRVGDQNAFRPDNTPKYYLANTHFRAVPMTGLQALRANALLGQRQSPESLLSPRQLALANQAKNTPLAQLPNYIGKSILAEWNW